MKPVWVKGRVDDHHQTLKGGTSNAIPVEFVSEWGEKEILWIKADQLKWRKTRSKK